jgi:hypothetical protein
MMVILAILMHRHINKKTPLIESINTEKVDMAEDFEYL